VSRKERNEGSDATKRNEALEITEQRRSRGLFRSLSDPSISQRRTSVYCSAHTETPVSFDLIPETATGALTGQKRRIDHFKPMTLSPN